MYEKELEAIQKAGLFRERVLYSTNLKDFASNDYLGLASQKKRLKKALKLLEYDEVIAPKSSMLVNGYHPIHRIFELEVTQANEFEEGIVVGSGFLANMALIETLVRKNDKLFIDEAYHASGVMASRLLGERVIKFRHNDPEDLRQKLQTYQAKRQIVAVEGVYSMSGDLCCEDIFKVADESGALLIVDEAHSAGVLGSSLLGIFDYYDITPHERHIKMGTLGKSYGSYGAYILASKEIISFLENRAKPIIYSTAPSVIDTALALSNFRHIAKRSDKYSIAIWERQDLIEERLGVEQKSLILPIPMQSNEHALSMQKELISKGYLVGAIRKPTVNKPILRVILSLGYTIEETDSLLSLISHNKVE